MTTSPRYATSTILTTKPSTWFFGRWWSSWKDNGTKYEIELEIEQARKCIADLVYDNDHGESLTPRDVCDAFAKLFYMARTYYFSPAQKERMENVRSAFRAVVEHSGVQTHFAARAGKLVFERRPAGLARTKGGAGVSLWSVMKKVRDNIWSDANALGKAVATCRYEARKGHVSRIEADKAAKAYVAHQATAEKAAAEKLRAAREESAKVHGQKLFTMADLKAKEAKEAAEAAEAADAAMDWAAVDWAAAEAAAEAPTRFYPPPIFYPPPPPPMRKAVAKPVAKPVVEIVDAVDEPLRVGEKVVTGGLQKTEYNGLVGTLERFDVAKQKWLLDLPQSQIFIKPTNLSRAPPDAEPEIEVVWKKTEPEPMLPPPLAPPPLAPAAPPPAAHQKMGPYIEQESGRKYLHDPKTGVSTWMMWDRSI